MTEIQLKQFDRPLFFNPPSGLDPDLFVLNRIEGSETISRLFQYRLSMVSTQTWIDPATLIGQPVSFGMTAWKSRRSDSKKDLEAKHYHGIISRFQAKQESPFGRVYDAEIVPSLWFLTLSTNSRVFQDVTLKKIIETVLKDYGITDFTTDLKKTTREFQYCVQYQESDFDFLSRLMEKEGVFYFFQHTEQAHQLVIADAADALQSITQPNLEYWNEPLTSLVLFDRGSDLVIEWEHTYAYRPEHWTLTDYNYVEHYAGTTKTPSSILEATKTTDTAFKANLKAKVEVFEYPGGYQTKADGKAYAKLRAETEKAQSHFVRGSSTCSRLAVGQTFKLFGHENKAENDQTYTLTEVTCNTVEDGPGGYTGYLFSFECVPVDRLPRPPRQTTLPRIHGAQPALVVGPKGEEIHTDEHGRIKIQFFWDRKGKRDGKQACWVRCAQSIAGKGWGSLFIPRIGQEVVVTFLNGDPDRPLVTGVVYNGEQTTPYKLPAKQTQSGLKTMSTLKGKTDTFNELRFDDKIDAEEIYFHAEKDFQRVVENNDQLKIGFEKKDAGNRDVEVFNNETITVGCSDAKDGSRALTVWKNHKINVKKGDETIVIDEGKREVTVKKGDHTLTVSKGNRVVNVDKGDDTITVGSGDRTVKVTSGAITYQAGKEILLKVGTNSIKIDSRGITMTGMSVKLIGKATVDIKAMEAKIKGAVAVMIKGGMLKLN